MEIVRKKLTEEEFSPSSIRYNEGTDTVQITPDGGATWVDNETLDPRHSDLLRLPPLTGSDKQCRAAAGMTALVRQLVDQRIDDATSVEFAGSILGIVAFIPGYNVLWALIVALATFAFTIGREILEAAFTEEVYDQIRCIFFCNIDADGQMSAEQFAEAYTQLDDLDTIPKLWVQNIFTSFGEVGLSDAGVALEQAADCDECACEWCAYQDFTTAMGDFVPGDSGIDWISGSGWRSKNYGGNNCQDLFGTLDLTDIAITYAAATLNRSCDIGGGNVVLTFRLLRDGSQQALYSNVPGVCGNPVTVELFDEVTIDQIYLDANSGLACGVCYLTRYELHGFGDPPPGWTLCE